MANETKTDVKEVSKVSPVVTTREPKVKPSDYTLKKVFSHDGELVNRDSFPRVAKDLSEAKLKQLKKDGYLI